jgi:hypothetical protein
MSAVYKTEQYNEITNFNQRNLEMIFEALITNTRIMEVSLRNYNTSYDNIETIIAIFVTNRMAAVLNTNRKELEYHSMKDYQTKTNITLNLAEKN